MERRLNLTIPSDGGTVDGWLRRQLGLSGTAVKRARRLEKGILLDSAPAFPNTPAATGQVLSVRVDDGACSGPEPQEGPLRILWEDEDLLVLDKAAGIPVHPGPGRPGGTVGNYVAAHYRAGGVTAGFHPVNRLDRGTSGLMVVAKHAFAQEKLIPRLHTGSFSRTYLAVCRGTPEPESGWIDAAIGREDGSVLRRTVRPDGAAARTWYETLKNTGGRALVRLVLDTGRTHQIRVHMAYIGHPLLGDFLYGTEDRGLIARAALHAAELSLRQPVTGEFLQFKAPLPEDMRRLL